MLKGGGSVRTERTGKREMVGVFVVGVLVAELNAWLVEEEAEAEAGLVEGDIMVGRPAMEAYIDDSWR